MGAERLTGEDRCAPERLAAAPNARCQNLIEERSAEFARVPPASLERRLPDPDDAAVQAILGSLAPRAPGSAPPGR